MSKIRLHGSSSGYTEIAPVAASGNNTLTLPNDGTIISQDSNGAVGVTSIKSSNVNVGAAVTITESGIEASGIGITCANINGTQIGGRRNIYINGAMTIAQRGTSSTEQGYKTVDRIRSLCSNNDEVATQAQVDVASGTTPYSLGFRKAFKLTNGNQTSGAGADDVVRMQSRLEAQDIANSGWNYKSSSSYITLSFWCKSTVSKNFYGQFFCQDSPFMQRSFETGTLSANTWTKVEVTIPGDSNINFDHNVGPGLIITWYLYAPTSYTSGNGALNTWMGSNASKRVPADSDAWWTADNATFDITGVQLEVGSTATNFELKNYDQNLWECKRYYQRSTDQDRGSNYSLQSSTWHSADGVQSFNKHGSYYDFKQNFEREMRVAPTLTIYGSSNQGDIHLESVAVGSKQVDWNNNTTEVKTKGFLLRHIEDQSDGNYTSGSGNAFGILAYTLDAEF